MILSKYNNIYESSLLAFSLNTKKIASFNKSYLIYTIVIVK